MGPPDESLLCHHGVFGSVGICLEMEDVVVDTGVCDVTCEVELACGVEVEVEIEAEAEVEVKVVLVVTIEELLVDVDSWGLGDGGATGLPRLVVDEEVLTESCDIGSGGALGLSCGFLGT
jgi:hypothetical protein